MPPPASFEPDDAQAAAAMLAHAAAERIMLVPHGNRTKLRTTAEQASLGSMSTARLTTGLAHYAGDLVATAPAGCTLADVNDVLARERQWIPLDPPHGTRATIGGIVAANDSGPRRHRFGSPRDLIIGIEVALADGRVAHSGGRVVKNVAGYDLGRLFCGSYGSLGVITSVTFKLAPLSRASRTVAAGFATAAQAASAAHELAASAALTPSCVEIVAPDPRLLVRFETTERSAEQMAAVTTSMLAGATTAVVTLAGDAETSAWAAHHKLESDDTGLVASISVLPTRVAGVIEDAERLGADHAVPWVLTGRAAMGVLRLRVNGEQNAVQAFATALRAAVSARQGHVQFTRGTVLLDPRFEPWGSPGTAAGIGVAVKQRFDPLGVLPYPWSRG